MKYKEYDEVIEQYQAWINQGAIEIKPVGKKNIPLGLSDIEPTEFTCTCGQTLKVKKTVEGSTIRGPVGFHAVVKRLACPNCRKQYVIKLETSAGIP